MVPRRDVAHQRGDWVLLLERHASCGQRDAHLLNIAEADAHAGTPKLDREADIARTNPPGDVVGFHFFRAASLDTGGLVRHARIRERAADDARPGQLIRLEGRGRTDVRLRLEANPHRGKHLPHRPHERRIQMFLAQAVEAGVALDTLVAVDGGALRRRVDVDGAHRAEPYVQLPQATQRRELIFMGICRRRARKVAALGVSYTVYQIPWL